MNTGQSNLGLVGKADQVQMCAGCRSQLQCALQGNLFVFGLVENHEDIFHGVILTLACSLIMLTLLGYAKFIQLSDLV